MGSKKRQFFNLKAFGQEIFAKFFGFEQGVDITNDVAVLYRRNIVIKNIIFISNLLYSVLLFLLSLGDNTVSNWVITVMVFPLTYVINRVLKKLINLDQEDKTKQTVAMYVGAFYIFFSSILIYARLYTIEHFSTGGYILIYYALVVVALYQEKKLLSSGFIFSLSLLTSIHLLWTYNLQGLAEGYTLIDFIPFFIQTPEFRDIIFRTLLFILFYFVVYATVSMGQYMQEERKNELSKRRQVQSDFTHIVGDLFSGVFSASSQLMEKRHAYHVQQISQKLAELFGMSGEKIDEIGQFALIHLRYQEIKLMISDMHQYNEQNYDVLKQKTELGSRIAKRMQLARKCEDITRAHLENIADEKFIQEMVLIQPEIDSQIILMAELYVNMRGPKSYKRPKPHAAVIKFFQEDFKSYFDFNLRERFLKFHQDFSDIYDNF